MLKKSKNLDSNVGDSVSKPFSDEMESSLTIRLGRAITDLKIKLDDEGLILDGVAHSYHVKQLAQELVMELTDTPIVANQIRVKPASIRTLQMN